MKAAIFLLCVLMQSPFIFGSSIVQHKCWLWDSPCLTSSAQAMVPTIAAGIPELGIEPLDVMVLDGLNINEDHYKHDWNTTYVQGIGNSIIDEIRVDLASKLVRIVFRSDLLVKSHYVQEGYLLSRPIDGAGEVIMEFYNVQTDMVMPFEIEKDVLGRDVMDLKGFQYLFKMQGAKIFFDNLYFGNNVKSMKMHVLINHNWKQLTTKYGPYLFDKTNNNIFNAIRTYLHSQPLETFCLL